MKPHLLILTLCTAIASCALLCGTGHASDQSSDSGVTADLSSSDHLDHYTPADAAPFLEVIDATPANASPVCVPCQPARTYTRTYIQRPVRRWFRWGWFRR